MGASHHLSRHHLDPRHLFPSGCFGFLSVRGVKIDKLGFIGKRRIRGRSLFWRKMRVRVATSANKAVPRLNAANLLRKPRFITAPQKTFLEKVFIKLIQTKCSKSRQPNLAPHLPSAKNRYRKGFFRVLPFLRLQKVLTNRCVPLSF